MTWGHRGSSNGFWVNENKTYLDYIDIRYSIKYWTQRILRPALTCETRCHLRGVLSNCQKVMVIEDSMSFCFELQSALLMFNFGPAGSWRPGFVKDYPNPNREHHQRWNPWRTRLHGCQNLRHVSDFQWYDVVRCGTIVPTFHNLSNRRCRNFSASRWAQSLERIRRHVLNAVTKMTLDCFGADS